MTGQNPKWFRNYNELRGRLTMPPSTVTTEYGVRFTMFPLETVLDFRNARGPKYVNVDIAVGGKLGKWAIETLSICHMVSVKGQLWPARMANTPASYLMLAAEEIEVLHVVDEAADYKPKMSIRHPSSTR